MTRTAVVEDAAATPSSSVVFSFRTLVLNVLFTLAVLALAGAVVPAGASAAQANDSLPELTAPVHDLAQVVDSGSAAELDRISRVLKAASGDVLVVVTVPTIAPYADIEEYAVALFENHGRGIGERNNDNGIMLLVAVQERRVRIEVGYGLEQWITDGYAGETIRDLMTPEFREGRYGAGLVAGAARIAGRIAQGRGVQLEGVEIPSERQPIVELPISTIAFIGLFLLFLYLNRNSGGPSRGVRRWGGNGWSRWDSGVGGFGGGFDGGWGRGSSGGGFGGGFGGFGGGRSGGGGASGGW